MKWEGYDGLRINTINNPLSSDFSTLSHDSNKHKNLTSTDSTDISLFWYNSLSSFATNVEVEVLIITSD